MVTRMTKPHTISEHVLLQQLAGLVNGCTELAEVLWYVLLHAIRLCLCPYSFLKTFILPPAPSYSATEWGGGVGDTTGRQSCEGAEGSRVVQYLVCIYCYDDDLWKKKTWVCLGFIQNPSCNDYGLWT